MAVKTSIFESGDKITQTILRVLNKREMAVDESNETIDINDLAEDLKRLRGAAKGVSIKVNHPPFSLKPMKGLDYELLSKIESLNPDPDFCVRNSASGEKLMACLWRPRAYSGIKSWRNDILLLVHFKACHPGYKNVFYLLNCTRKQLGNHIGNENLEQFYYLLTTFSIRLIVKASPRENSKGWYMLELKHERIEFSRA